MNTPCCKNFSFFPFLFQGDNCFNIDEVEDNKDSHSSDALFSIYSTLECYMIYTYASTNCMLIDIL